jgi:hypothetical protein
VFFGVEGEGVYVNTVFGGVAEVLPRLAVVEVLSFTFRESVLAVELE